VAAVVAAVAEAAELAAVALVAAVAVVAAAVAALRGELAAFAKADLFPIALTNEVSGRVRQCRPGQSMWCGPHVIFAHVIFASSGHRLACYSLSLSASHILHFKYSLSQQMLFALPPACRGDTRMTTEWIADLVEKSTRQGWPKETHWPKEIQWSQNQPCPGQT
jgi:hypothetical protein